jgi:UDP-N-acetylmuramoylalanine--D-glutamate ligase
MSDSVKSIVILGLARQGVALARYFSQRGMRVTVSDSRSAGALSGSLAALSDLEVSYVLGDHPLSLLDGCDLLCLSGGVSPDMPLVHEAVRRGIPLSNDAQEFLARCPAPVVGITGSAGKTTTTTWVGEMLDRSGFRTWVGGNIGNPLILELEKIQPHDRVVMELSSFQLELMKVSPRIAGVLNITPNHLDRHKTMEAYIAAKRNIVTNQRTSDMAILGYDEPNARALAQATSAEVRFFSTMAEVPSGAFLREDRLMLRRDTGDIEVAGRQEVRVRGAHNVANALAAIALADAAGGTVEAMREAIGSFSGVAHRLEEVRVLRDVLWVNDSIATAPERVLAALSAFDESVVLLAGGRDKDLPWRLLAERVVERVRVLVVFGEAAGMIEAEVAAALTAARGEGRAASLEVTVKVDTLDAAVAVAAARAQPGEVVLLSPGGTSFDAYQDFAERGEWFRHCVTRLE